ncbi:MAG: hypothetical protein ABSA71_05675 [Desulfomonilia bacterium]|jgi:hypothetical protein
METITLPIGNFYPLGPVSPEICGELVPAKEKQTKNHPEQERGTYQDQEYHHVNDL